MHSIRPVSPDDLRREFAASAFHFNDIADNRRWTLEAIFILPKLLLRHDLARLQGDALNPVTHPTMASFDITIIQPPRTGREADNHASIAVIPKLAADVGLNTENRLDHALLRVEFPKPSRIVGLNQIWP